MVKAIYSKPEVKPSLGFNHVPFKESLKSFAKLHPGLVGVEPPYQDGLFNQISLSVRLLLGFFKKCAAEPNSWEIAKRNFKGTGNLDVVAKVIAMVVVKVDKKQKDDQMKETETDWQMLQDSAPKLSFWQVMTGNPKCF